MAYVSRIKLDLIAHYLKLDPTGIKTSVMLVEEIMTIIKETSSCTNNNINNNNNNNNIMIYAYPARTISRRWRARRLTWLRGRTPFLL